jgi:adenylate kinase
MKRRVILLGPPGSGKGTFAAQLQKVFGYCQLSSGHWLRREVEMDTTMGRRVKMFLDRGDLVPDELVLEFMEERLQSELAGGCFLLDGFPRTLGQAKALDEWLIQLGAPIEVVVFYDCSETILVDRITGRRACPRCGRCYHTQSLRPHVAGRCDECHDELVQREDDTEPVLRRRLEVYTRQTEPLVDYYRRQAKLKVIDAAMPSDAVYAASVEALM